MGILAILSLFALGYAVNQKRQAEDTLTRLEIEKHDKEDLQIQLLRQDAYTFMQAEEWVFALQKLNEAKGLMHDHDKVYLDIVNTEIYLCHSKIEKQ